MRVESQIENGTEFRFITSHQYASLRKLEAEYQKLGKRTWFNLYDMCRGIWMLTIEIGKCHGTIGLPN